MSYTLTCPRCQYLEPITREQLGTMFRCPGCHHQIHLTESALSGNPSSNALTVKPGSGWAGPAGPRPLSTVMPAGIPRPGRAPKKDMTLVIVLGVLGAMVVGTAILAVAFLGAPPKGDTRANTPFNPPAPPGGPPNPPWQTPPKQRPQPKPRVVLVVREGQERIRNGNFEAGNTDFHSDYLHNPAHIRDDHTFAVVSSPRRVHDSAAEFSDHTTGKGLMMAANGGPETDRLIWGQTVAVRPGADYVFSLWVASWYPSSPAEIEVRINGKSLGRVVAPVRGGEWKQLSASWNSGTDKSAAIDIFDLNAGFSGNDFALDDISLLGPPPLP